MQQPQSRQSENHSTPEINDPDAKIIPQKAPSQSRGGKNKLRSNPNPSY